MGATREFRNIKVNPSGCPDAALVILSARTDMKVLSGASGYLTNFE